MKQKITETCSAEAFQKDGIYTFPFQVLDDTPGGSNLGRIHWGIELIPGRKKEGRTRFEKILVFARQTRDKRYDGKVFEIACFTDALQGGSFGRRDDFLKYVWNLSFCPEHRAPVMMAYPDNKHSRLVIDPRSSIMIEARFE